MASQKPLAILAIGCIVLVGIAGPVAAHGWQTTVTTGAMELGVSSTPEEPLAGLEAEFAARIKDAEAAGDANRTSWGGVTNNQVEVHIRGPDGYHDHLKTTIPKDEAHFHWTYRFPTDGTYSIAVVTELEGQEYSFQFQRNVTLLPSKATGEEMGHLSEEVHSLGENVSSTAEDVAHLSEEIHAVSDNVSTAVEAVSHLSEDLHGVSENVSATADEVGHVHEKVDSLESQVSDLQSQVDSLEQQLADQQSKNAAATAGGPGFTVIAAGVGLALVAVVVLTRRL